MGLERHSRLQLRIFPAEASRLHQARLRFRGQEPADGTHGTFDPNVHDHLGVADLFAWQNMKSGRGGARFSLLRNGMLAGMYDDFWLASATDAYYNSSGSAVVRDPKGLSGTHMGRELDVETSYRFDRNLEFGVGLGHFFSGEFLLRNHRARAYTYPYVMMNHNFN